MRTFSYRYRSLLGITGTWDPAARTGSLDIVLLGMLIGINLGLAIRTPAG